MGKYGRTFPWSLPSAVYWFNQIFYSAVLIVWFVVFDFLCLFFSVFLASSTSLYRFSTDVLKQFALASSLLNSSFKSSLSFSKFRFPISSSATVSLRCHLLFSKFSFLKDNLLTRVVFMLEEESMVKVADHYCALTASSLSKCDTDVTIPWFQIACFYRMAPCLQDVVIKISEGVLRKWRASG